MIRLGLTGSIGMGKSTTTRMFADAGYAAYDADAAVHVLYSGKAAPLIEAAFPGTVTGGTVDRATLSNYVIGDAVALRRLEAIVHPLVREAEAAFLERARRSGARGAVLDIPLLFETDGDERVDATVVVTCDAAIQRARVLARDGMTEEKFAEIVSRQIPDREKRARSHFLVDSGHGFEAARRQVQAIVKALAAGAG